MKNSQQFEMTEELREASRAFMQGFWDDSESGRIARAGLQSAWNAYRRKPHYERLRQRLSEAAKDARKR